MWTDDILEVGSRAKVAVAITFHYVEGRLRYLADVIRTLASFPVSSLAVRIHTNPIEEAERRGLERIVRSAGLTGAIIPVGDMTDPFHLTWAHKPYIERWLKGGDDADRYFIYIEDDERLTWENFLYLLYARRELSPHGLLPGLVRYEWNAATKSFVSLDITEKIDLGRGRHVEGQNWSYVDPGFPYCGSFMLDPETAKEYVGSPSFDRDRSEFISWNVRERAAAGLTWERVPAGFSSRIVVPVDPLKMSIVPACWLAHLPNNHADNPSTLHGKIAMDDLVIGELDPSNALPRAAPGRPAAEA